MHKFTYRFLKNATITADLFSLSNIIVDLRARIESKKESNPQLFAKIQSVAIKESVLHSNAIEGIHSTPERVAAIIEQDAVPLTHDEKEIAGYGEALRFIGEHYEELDFDEETIKTIHAMVVGKNVGPEKGRRYKSGNNEIAEMNADGTVKRVVFTPVSAKETPKAMADLCLAFRLARSDAEIPMLLLIPCAILDFLAIHPFDDGNGRVSRLLTLLLLYKEGYDIGKYISLERRINENKGAYYASLEESQSKWHDAENDYRPFIRFMFQILYLCFKEMNRRFIAEFDGKRKKNERIEAVVLHSIVPISKNEIQELFPDIAITTIEAVLAKLVADGKIRKIGTYKDAKYFRK